MLRWNDAATHDVARELIELGGLFAHERLDFLGMFHVPEGNL